MKLATVALVSPREALGHQLAEQLKEKDIALEMLSPVGNLFADQVVPPDLVVLHCQPMAVEGLAICREIRGCYAGPLVLLSDPGEERFSLLALQLGADCNLSADSSIELIAANLKALLSRFTRLPFSTYQHGELLVDARQRDAFLSGRSVRLSTIEFRLLWLLCRMAGQVVPREVICRELYSAPYNGYDRSIDLYVSRIRQKIGDLAAAPTYLKTVRGFGYQLVSPPELP